MTLLCLFVVLGALFITVFNSRTTNHISTADSVLTIPTRSSTKNLDQGLDAKNSQIKPLETTFPKKESNTSVLPTFS